MSQQQLNLRVSKSFALGGRARVEAFGVIFNLFNSVNPSGFRARVTVPTTGLPDPNLLQPTTFSGDAQRPEQRVGQIGFRFLLSEVEAPAHAWRARAPLPTPQLHNSATPK